jgi:hypothetical protein
MTQVRIAVIAYLLFYLLKMKSKRAGLSFTIFIPVIKTVLFQRMPLFEWLTNPDPPPPKPAPALQPVFEFVW